MSWFVVTESDVIISDAPIVKVLADTDMSDSKYQCVSWLFILSPLSCPFIFHR